MTNKSSITKNTIALYIRMLFSLAVSLYASRIILDVLGVDDYGIYIAVGGIAGFISFINSALGNASTRFITFSLGTNNKLRMEETFSTALSVHIILAILIVILGETIGLWFLYHKMVIPDERLFAAVWVFHISIITVFFTITQVPFTASINAHEHMNIYAYASILESVLKLAIIFILKTVQYDKLIIYSILYFIITLLMLMFYRFYCYKHFSETHYNVKLYNKHIFKEISTFSGWSFLNSGGIALNVQGILLLLNIFFSPAIVSARAISLQVNGLAMQFSNNFRAAANPQIIKRYANNENDNAKKLVLKTAKYSYLLMWLLALPICFLADPLLHLWLKTVPPYTTIFLQLAVIQSLFSTLNSSLFMAFYAKGLLKINTLITTSMYFIQFPIVYIFFRLGYSPITLSIACLTTDIILGVIIQPILLIKLLNYSWSDLVKVFSPCLKVSFISIIFPLAIYISINIDTIIEYFLLGVSCSICSLFSIWQYGLETEMRQKIRRKVQDYIYKL